MHRCWSGAVSVVGGSLELLHRVKNDTLVTTTPSGPLRVGPLGVVSSHDAVQRARDQVAVRSWSVSAPRQARRTGPSAFENSFAIAPGGACRTGHGEPTMTITVYSKPACVQCNATYRALDKLDADYTVVDIT